MGVRLTVGELLPCAWIVFCRSWWVAWLDLTPVEAVWVGDLGAMGSSSIFGSYLQVGTCDGRFEVQNSSGMGLTLPQKQVC